MAQTVVGLFENYTEAQQAAERLQQIGLGDSQVDISSGSGRDTELRDSDDHENGITRFFKNLFGDSDDSERYARVGNSGTSIVTVHAETEEQATRAAELLDEAGAIDVDERATRFQTGQNFTSARSDSDSFTSGRSTDSDSFRSGRSDDSDSDESNTVQRVEEDLQVGKRTVETGGVRLRSRIIEKPVEESIRLREERVHVEREPVDRPVTDLDRAAFQDRDIELTERSEVPVVNKEARVVEEVKLSKDVTERNETVRDTVRRTEVDIDELKDRDTDIRR